MPLTKSGAEIWRKYVTDGVPASGLHKPDQNDIQRWAAELEAAAGVSAATRVTANGNIDVTPSQTLILVAQAAPGAIDINLPAGDDHVTGRITIVDLNRVFGANIATVKPDGAETIMGAANWPMASNGESLTFNFDPTSNNWYLT
jgi:hypothetical protein